MLATEIEKKLAFDLRGSWQARALAQTSGPARMVVLSVLAHTLDEATFTLCAVVFPDFDGSLKPPFLTSAAKIDKRGAIVADMVDERGRIHKDLVLFPTEIALRDAFRKLADRLKLNDADRVEMFKYAQRWVVADRRLDPNFDRRDPDAKRIH
jgi:predicted O-methyltransferase YrrM